MWKNATLLHSEPPQNITTAKEFVNEALSIVMHAMRAGIHTILGSSPGSLVFNRDMFLNIPLIADWHAITLKWEHLIHENLLSENQKRRKYDYVICTWLCHMYLNNMSSRNAPCKPEARQVEQRILKKRLKPRKLDKRTSGLYRVVQIL